MAAVFVFAFTIIAMFRQLSFRQWFRISIQNVHFFRGCFLLAMVYHGTMVLSQNFKNFVVIFSALHIVYVSICATFCMVDNKNH